MPLCWRYRATVLGFLLTERICCKLVVSCWIDLSRWLSNVACIVSPGELVKPDLCVHCQISNSVSVGLGLWIYISDKFPVITADGTSKNPWLKRSIPVTRTAVCLQHVWFFKSKFNVASLNCGYLTSEGIEGYLLSKWMVSYIFLSFCVSPLWWN